ncbi:MAG: three-Cys-motif partner protein TcmP, partial [Gammaproteobacteria bacterium]|nr:three-Cys-motif partner protein TcmP [Gammaproteobacteria bacterium]
MAWSTMPCPHTLRGRIPMSFKWHPDQPPPPIQPHSKAKLKVLRSYLRAYFDRLNVNPNREEFKLDLIDGFAGGGTFLDKDSVVPGTPLIMLEEAAEAEKRLNKGRIKKLNIDCKFYFVDKSKAHIDHLTKVLAERGYRSDNSSIVVRNGPFESQIESII